MFVWWIGRRVSSWESKQCHCLLARCPPAPAMPPPPSIPGRLRQRSPLTCKFELDPSSNRTLCLWRRAKSQRHLFDCYFLLSFMFSYGEIRNHIPKLNYMYHHILWLLDVSIFRLEMQVVMKWHFPVGNIFLMKNKCKHQIVN